MRCGCPRLSRRPRGSWGGRRPGRISAWWKWPLVIRAEARRSRPAGAWLRLKPAGWCSLWLTPPCSDRRFTLMHALADTLRTYTEPRGPPLSSEPLRGHVTALCSVGPAALWARWAGWREEGGGRGGVVWWRAAVCCRCLQVLLGNCTEPFREDHRELFLNSIFDENKNSAKGRWGEMCHTSKASMTLVWLKMLQPYYNLKTTLRVIAKLTTSYVQQDINAT